MLPDTLLGPEATGPAAPTPAGGKCRPPGWGVVVVAPSWWWGVVFDLWIVVANIRCGAFVCRVCCGVIFSHFYGFLCCKCLRAHGGCLGTGSR